MQCLIEARSIWFQSISALGVKTVFKLSVSYVCFYAQRQIWDFMNSQCIVLSIRLFFYS
jgi:hypothetical protein